MAYYQEQGGPLRRYGEISHFRQPYKDYTTLAGFGDAAMPTLGGVNANLVAGLWYVNDSIFASKLQTMALSEPASSASSPTVQTSQIVTASGGQLQPANSASNEVLSRSASGYASLLTVDASGNQLVLFTNDAATIAALAGGPNPTAAIIVAPPTLGVQATAIVTPSTAPTLSTAAPQSGSSLGPIGIAVVVAAAAAGAYYGLRYLKRRRKI